MTDTIDLHKLKLEQGIMPAHKDETHWLAFLFKRPAYVTKRQVGLNWIFKTRVPYREEWRPGDKVRIGSRRRGHNEIVVKKVTPPKSAYIRNFLGGENE